VPYIGAEGLTPKGLDQVVQTRATAFKVLPIAAKQRWLAVLFVVGLEAAQQVQSKGIVVVLAYTLLFAVAMILLAARIWQAAARPAAQANKTVQTPLAAASPDPAAAPPQTGPAS
jgi:hypothetical protein